jgi:type II secretory pathway pseudopilin PulG
VDTSGRRRRGFGMVESIICVVLVGGVVVAALNNAGATFTNRRLATDRIRAQLLAGELMSEILAQHYEDPLSPVFGLEPDENALFRTTFDDVDDYRNHTDSPPKSREGVALSGYSDYSRIVAVVRADRTNPNNISLSESGLKRITVTVKVRGKTAATVTALRSGAIQAAGKNNLLGETVDYVERTSTNLTAELLD